MFRLRGFDSKQYVDKIMSAALDYYGPGQEGMSPPSRNEVSCMPLQMSKGSSVITANFKNSKPKI